MQFLLTNLQSKIPFHEKNNPLISNSSVGWHIEHSLKTIFIVVQSVKKSNPKEYKWKFNKNKLVISFIGFFPRGKAKAPKVVLPEGTITNESLQISLQKVKSALEEWESFNKNAHFYHPYFGNLNKKSTKWFLNLHTKHHWKIINDICKKI